MVTVACQQPIPYKLPYLSVPRVVGKEVRRKLDSVGAESWRNFNVLFQSTPCLPFASTVNSTVRSIFSAN
jgi:hypothetical protein